MLETNWNLDKWLLQSINHKSFATVIDFSGNEEENPKNGGEACAREETRFLSQWFLTFSPLPLYFYYYCSLIWFTRFDLIDYVLRFPDVYRAKGIWVGSNLRRSELVHKFAAKCSSKGFPLQNRVETSRSWHQWQPSLSQCQFLFTIFQRFWSVSVTNRRNSTRLS